VLFEPVDYRHMCEIAAYDGFPTRYPHWRFGMEYDHMLKSHTYGLSKIYELVINTNPCYAYLLEGNSLVDQKLVMAHVCAHCDFFKNNYFFSHTDRRMIDGMANNASRVRRYMDRHGVSTVESFIDVCLSLDNLIDPWLPFREKKARRPPSGATDSASELRRRGRARGPDRERPPAQRSRLPRGLHQPARVHRGPAGQEEAAGRDRQAQAAARARARRARLPDAARAARRLGGRHRRHPARGVVLLPAAAADQDHERGLGDLLALEDHDDPALRDDEIIDYADAASGVTGHGRPASSTRTSSASSCTATSRSAGTGASSARSGTTCSSLQERTHWDMKLGLGKQKIFEVRRMHNDVTFLDEFFTEDFCRDQKFFTFKENRRTGRLEIEGRSFAKIKAQMLQQLSNFGQPFIYVVDANYLNRGELLLGHRHEGVDLKADYARDTLRSLERVWRRPVSLLTILDDKAKRIRFDGSEISMSDEPHAFRV
jgi:stage V sporulation protein R